MKQERSADRRKYHVIYKTTCLVTGRYYIGMHSTDDLADGYIGSGKRLWQSIRKHGAERHVCEVLEHLPSRAALKLREAELVNEQLLEDKLCMNIALGGEGDWAHCNAKLTAEQRTKAGLAGGFANKSLWSAKALEQMKDASRSKMLKLRSRQTKTELSKYSLLGRIKAAQPEANNKRKASMNGKHVGKNNPQYGKRWVTNGSMSKTIYENQLDEHLKSGWSLGRTVYKLKPMS